VVTALVSAAVLHTGAAVAAIHLRHCCTPQQSTYGLASKCQPQIQFMGLRQPVSCQCGQSSMQTTLHLWTSCVGHVVAGW
jgi:hypothetical protein